jgi:hypothetical protein
MKKLILLLAMVSIAFISCNQEYDEINATPDAYVAQTKIKRTPVPKPSQELQDAYNLSNPRAQVEKPEMTEKRFLTPNAQLIPVSMHTPNTTPHFKVYIIAEGYTAMEQSLFNAHAIDVMNSLKTVTPFNTNINKINFYRINTFSNESGVSKKDVNGLDSLVVDTRWGAFIGNQGMPWFYGYPQSTRTELRNWYANDSKGEQVYIVLLSNYDGYAGYGEYATYVEDNIPVLVTSREASSIGFLMKHEFGHSFGGLDDEYVDQAYADSQAGIDYYANYPNGLNTKDTNPGGWLPGCRYTIDKFRFDDGLMKAVDYDYHPRNQGLIQDRIDDEAITERCPIPNNPFYPNAKIDDDTSFRKTNYTGGEWHYTAYNNGTYGKWQNLDYRFCGGGYGVYGYTALSKMTYDLEIARNTVDSDYYIVSEWQDWDLWLEPGTGGTPPIIIP